MVINLVEMIQDGDSDCAWDQPCKFGHRVEGHAVYCHNESWDDSPRKCRRTWATGGDIKDEDCPGFQRNIEFAGALDPTPVAEPRCTKCGGSKLVESHPGRTKTCTRCMGEGRDPQTMKLSDFAQNVLERLISDNLGDFDDFDPQAVIADSESDAKDVLGLERLSLVEIRSMQARPKMGITVFLCRLTGKGAVVLRAIWKAKLEKEKAE